MVSVAVLIGLLGMVAMIFSSAGKASGQAQATTALYRVVEQIGENIRQDLESMDPQQSVLGLARVDVLAYATTDDAQSGRALIIDPSRPDSDWHRADVLMLVSKRKFDPYVFQAQTGDAFEEYRHVVYEHANFGRLVQTGTNTWGWAPNVNNVEPANSTLPSPIPSAKWHLARRVVGSVTQATINANVPAFQLRPNVGLWPLASSVPPASALNRFSGEDPDPTHFSDLLADTTVAGPTWRTLPALLDEGTYGLSRGTATYSSTGSLQSFYHRDSNGYYYRWESIGGTNTLYCLAADKADPLIVPSDPHLYWWKLNPATPAWERTTFVPGTGTVTRTWPTPPGTNPPPMFTPPDKPPNGRFPRDTALPTLDGFNWLQWFYMPGTTPPGASRVRLDPNPPPGRTDMMAAYFLPGCSDFKVEFTYDDPREIAVERDPTKTAPTPYGEPYLTPDNGTQPKYDIDGLAFVNIAPPATMGMEDKMPVPQPIRWQSIPSQWEATAASVPWRQVWVWNRLGVSPSDYQVGTPTTDLRDLTNPYRWPRAIRITIRAWDPAGRLPDPIVHTIVHTFK